MSIHNNDPDRYPSPRADSGAAGQAVRGRRDFLRQGSVVSAVVASGLTGVHAIADDSDVSRSASETINLAVIGSGGRGGGAATNSLSINENVRIVALADLYYEKSRQLRRGLAQRFPEKVDIPDQKVYGGMDAYRKVLDDPDVDVVLLTTSPGFRPYHLAEAVKAGKHVFAEKPVCVDPAGYHICLDAHDQAVKNRTSIVTGTQYRRQTNYIGVVKQIHEGAIGDIVSATTRYCSTGIWYRGRKDGMSDAEYQLNNWMHFIWLSGDQITEQAVHNIDLLNWVMGSSPLSAYGSGGRFTRPQDSQMWDNMELDYEYPGNRVLSFMCRQIPGTQPANGSVIYGTEATAYIPPGTGTSRIVDRRGKEIWSMGGNIAEAYEQEHKDLIDSVRAGEPIVELRETAKSSLTAVMGRMAAYTGQRVTWDFVATESKLDLFPKDLTWDSELPQSRYAMPGTEPLV